MSECTNVASVETVRCHSTLGEGGAGTTILNRPHYSDKNFPRAALCQVLGPPGREGALLHSKVVEMRVSAAPIIDDVVCVCATDV